MDLRARVHICGAIPSSARPGKTLLPFAAMRSRRIGASGLLTCGCCPEARPRQEPRPAQPRPGQGEGRGGGREHGHGGGESDQGGGQGAGLGHNKQGA